MITNNNETTITLARCLKDGGIEAGKDIASIFYLMPIHDTIKDDIYDVTNYEVKLIPVIALMVTIEQIIRIIMRKQLSRFEDCFINIASSLVFTLTRVVMFTIVLRIYSWLYTNYALVHLPLHSASTWIISLLLVEFVYYWTHRALHEFNFLWAAHQFHHMAEDVNISTTIRDSVVDLVIYDIFPIPLALFIHPQILFVHLQFSLIYQIWLHNEVVGHLGPLEYLINTPRQHRVHHGKNPYCIDKNYGALLMIWDRIFGTYQVELDEEKIVFGTVSPTPKTFDMMTLMFGYYKNVWQRFKNCDNYREKMASLFYGPGWSPGKPRLGLIEEIPEVDHKAPRYIYTPYVAIWKKAYILFHSVAILIGFYMIADHPLIKFDPWKMTFCMTYLLLAITSFGALFDNRSYLIILEIFRCIVYFVFDQYVLQSTQWPVHQSTSVLIHLSLWTIRLGHLLSIMFWICMWIINLFTTNTIDDKHKSPKMTSSNEKIIYDSNEGQSQTSTDSDETLHQDSTYPVRLKASTFFILMAMMVFVFVPLTMSYLFVVPSCSRYYETYFFDRYLSFAQNITKMANYSTLMIGGN
ncbi:alkylglycerol monooxygenase-like protein 2 [Dermatophagoides farinae]|uniref:Alkylglycerol monooxygenase n=1 Tax=Dermatophagoides farinae TaxID=6954 RepID=A0A9D4NRM4_DERFA|nr:alkylglycerol monooxygenase-like [Dermatophagoides farinae]KAH7637081.1 alkylglycerol monooxygenase-like protein 2 [Dermatophagoides farinae]